MSNDLWRWADPDGQQRRVRLDELRAALAGGHIAPNTPVWRAGWRVWQSAHEVPELTSSALSAANGVVPNIPPPPLAMVAVQHEFEANARGSFSPPRAHRQSNDEPPPPPHYVPLPTKAELDPARRAELGTAAVGRAARAVDRGTPSVPPIAPTCSRPPSLPTTIGLPPPPEMLALAAAQKAQRGRTSRRSQPRQGSDDRGAQRLHAPRRQRPAAQRCPACTAHRWPGGGPPGYMPPPTDPIVHEKQRASEHDRRPRRRRGSAAARRPQLTALFDDFKEMKAGRPPKNKLLVGVVAGARVLGPHLVPRARRQLVPRQAERAAVGRTSASHVVLVVGDGDRRTARRPREAPPPTATATTATFRRRRPPPSPTAETKGASTEGALGDCAMAGEAHVVSPRAFVQAGVEAVTVPGAIAIGFALDPRNGQAVTVDPAIDRHHHHREGARHSAATRGA